jgi:hypothetical protein
MEDEPQRLNIIMRLNAVDDESQLAGNALFKELSDYINQLILKDFEYLVSLLYRIDVDENKLRSILEDHPQEDAADSIATLVIERQMQKIHSRKKFTPPRAEGDEEAW